MANIISKRHPAPTPNIWEELPHPCLILAPMEGVTDAIFRQVVARAGRPDLFFTEFTNVSSFVSEKGRANALERLTITPSDPPIIAQIWGKNPEHFALCAAGIEQLDFRTEPDTTKNSTGGETTQDPAGSEAAQNPAAPLRFAGIDLNYGCPDRHVNKAGGGAAMIQNPDLALACLKATQAATSLPVSVKTRLGWSRVEEFRTWLPLLLSAHPATLTVHLRTKKEMSKVPAHYEVIPDILALRAELSPDTRLIINGDIADRAGAIALHTKYPAIDGLMIGRGVFQNPFCFVDATDTHQPPTPPTTSTALSTYRPTRAELIDLLKFHLDLYEQATKTRYLSYEPLKHFFKIYINHFPGASAIRAELMATHSVPEARAIIAKLTNS